MKFRIEYRDVPKDVAGYLAVYPDGREVAVGAAGWPLSQSRCARLANAIEAAVGGGVEA